MTLRSDRFRTLLLAASFFAALLGPATGAPARAQVPEAAADTVALPVADTVVAPVRSVGRRAFVGGTLGSALGLAGGAVVGVIAGERACRPPRSGEYFCGVGEALLGMAAGSVAGAATGAYIGAHSAGHDPSIGATIAGAFLGLGAGIALGALLSVTDNAGIVIIGFTVGQGAVTGRFASRNLPARREPEAVPPGPEAAPHH